MDKSCNYKNWLLLVYPDEAYSDWYSRLKNTGLEIAYSPLHENDNWRPADEMLSNPRCGNSKDIKDYNISLKFKELFNSWLEKHKDNLESINGEIPTDQVYAEGKPKKPHYHVVIHSSGSKSEEQLKEIARECIAPDPPLPIRCKGISGSIRYLVHYDDPDKEQFPISSIVTLNGFDIDRYFKPTVAQEDELFYMISHICHANELYSFNALMDWLAVRSKTGDFLEEFRYCRSHCNLIKAYVDGRGRCKRYKEVDEFEKGRVQALYYIADQIKNKDII